MFTKASQMVPYVLMRALAVHRGPGCQFVFFHPELPEASIHGQDECRREHPLSIRRVLDDVRSRVRLHLIWGGCDMFPLMSDEIRYTGQTVLFTLRVLYWPTFPQGSLFTYPSLRCNINQLHITFRPYITIANDARAY